MNNRNNLSFTGRLTKDCAVKTVGDKAVASMSVAINRSFKKQDGSYANEVTYLDVECWVKNSAYYTDNFKKGTFIDFTGELRQKRWEKDGQTFSKLYAVPTRPIEILSIAKQGNGEPLPAQEKFEVSEPVKATRTKKSAA